MLGTEAAGDSLTPQFIVEEPNLASVVWEGRAVDGILEKIRVRSTGEWCYGEENMSKIWVWDVEICYGALHIGVWGQKTAILGVT